MLGKTDVCTNSQSDEFVNETSGFCMVTLAVTEN